MLNSLALSTSAVKVSFEENGTAVIVPQVVELLHAEATQLTELVVTLQEKNVTSYIFDLGDLIYISSEALGSIANCWKWCRDDNRGAMSVVLSSNPANSIRNLFEIIGLSRMIGSAVQFSVADAKNYLKQFG